MAHTRFPQLHVGRPAQVGAVSVFPVWTDAPQVRGLGSGFRSVTVAEREGAPVVGELVVANHGTSPVLLLAGELFEGGWQHRALVRDVVLEAGRIAVVPVSCVEQGRWTGHDGADTQVRRGRRASLTVRAAQGSSPTTQRGVWERVRRFDEALGGSATGSLLHHLDRGEVDRPGAMPLATPEAPPVPPVLDGQRGVLLGIGGQPAVLELFPTTSLLRRRLPALLAAAQLDAMLLPPQATPARRARRFLSRVDGLFAAPGGFTRRSVLGEDGEVVEGEDALVRLDGVLWRDRLAHLTIVNRVHELVLAA